MQGGLIGGGLAGNSFAALNQAACATQQGPAYDPVTAPKGYCRHKTTTVQLITDWGLDFFLGNVLQYIERHDVKGGVEDLRKARKYLDMKIELEETGTLKETISHG